MSTAQAPSNIHVGICHINTGLECPPLICKVSMFQGVIFTLSRVVLCGPPTGWFVFKLHALRNPYSDTRRKRDACYFTCEISFKSLEKCISVMTPLRFARLTTVHHDCMTAYTFNLEDVPIQSQMTSNYSCEIAS
jgi:hypothetical protein